MHTQKVASGAGMDAGATAEIIKETNAAIGKWDKWSKQIGGRKRPSGLRKLLSANSLFWGLSTDEVIHCGTISRLVGLKKRTAKAVDDFDWTQAVRQWISNSQHLERREVIEAVAWSHALPLMVTRISQVDWVNLLATLVSSHRLPTADPFIRFVMSTEVPLTLAYALPELELCCLAKDQARQTFSELLDAMLDGEGMPHAQHLDFIQLLLASCSRTIVLDTHVKKGRIDKAARLQYDWLARQTLRWSRPNGTTIFTNAVDSPFFDELVSATLQLTKDQSDVEAYRVLRGKRKLQNRGLPPCSEHSEWSELATLRTSWSPDACRLGVRFSRNALDVEIGVGECTLISGSCLPQVVVDGEQLKPESEWDEVCWESDNDMDYIELECQMSGGWRVQRQFLLARKDQFAFIADAVLGPHTATIEYQHPLPLADGIDTQQSQETNEATIQNAKRLGTIIPLSLPEWQTESRTERLRSDPTRLEMERRGRALFAPLFIDLHPGRVKKALTWRRLTVAENLQPLPPESAVAYRVQIGKQQWAFYRSLNKPTSRTFLGLNIISEFLAARFNANGEIETLIDIAG